MEEGVERIYQAEDGEKVCESIFEHASYFDHDFKAAVIAWAGPVQDWTPVNTNHWWGGS